MTVNELAKQAGLPLDTVRYYLRIGLLTAVSRQDNGYRVFSLRDVKYLRFIRQAKHLGFTLTEIRTILQDARDGTSPCPLVRDIIQRRIEETRRKVSDLLSLQERMEKALTLWQKMPDRCPDGDSLCHLIEATDTPETSATTGGQV